VAWASAEDVEGTNVQAGLRIAGTVDGGRLRRREGLYACVVDERRRD
jgi:hypothetical protein